MPEVVASQERLKSLNFGNALPFSVPETMINNSEIIISSQHAAVSSSKRSPTMDRSREDSLSDSHDSRIKNSNSTEILHVGIDAGADIKVIFRENSSESLNSGLGGSTGEIRSTPKLGYRQANFEGSQLSPLHEETVELVARTVEDET